MHVVVLLQCSTHALSIHALSMESQYFLSSYSEWIRFSTRQSDLGYGCGAERRRLFQSRLKVTSVSFEDDAWKLQERRSLASPSVFLLTPFTVTIFR